MQTVSTGGRNYGKRKHQEDVDMARAALSNAKAELYAQYLELSKVDINAVTKSDMALMEVLLTDPDIQIRIKKYLSKRGENGTQEVRE